MATRPEPQRHDMAQVYVAKRLEGMGGREAMRVAGYSEHSKLTDIHRPGGPVDRELTRVFADKGITPDFLAGEYKTGIAQAQRAGAKEKDLGAHAQYLKQIGYLLGYGRPVPAPTVAVQINNQAPTDYNEPGRAEEALREISILLDELKTAISERESSVLPGGSPAADGGDSLLAETAARDGVVPSGPDSQPAPGGGGA